MYQLLYVFIVENVLYECLEVFLFGLDCFLKKFIDFVCFVDCEVVVKLCVLLFGMFNCKIYEGVLCELEGEELVLEFEVNDGLVVVLNFMLVDVDKVYLVLQVDFRSCKG